MGEANFYYFTCLKHQLNVSQFSKKNEKKKNFESQSNLRMPGLEVAHKEFLQAIMSFGIMNARTVKDVIHDIMRRHGIQSDFATFMTSVIAAINSSLEPYDMQIKKCICEVVGTNYYALVNQTEHPLNKLSPLYTPVQLELFKRIVEEVVTSESGTVTSIQVLNFEFDETVKFSRKEREETLTKMTDEMWLMQEAGVISLSARTINELEVYIKEVHKDDAIICPACNQLVIRGQHCARDSCPVRVHNHCAKKLFKTGTQRKCPTCKTAWNLPTPNTTNTQTMVADQASTSADTTITNGFASTSTGRRGRSAS